LNVSPNPASNFIIANVTNAIADQYMITDLLGRELVSTKSQQQESVHIDISGLSSGVYFLGACTENGVITKKFSVVR
jgi:hypothetical protein